MTPKILYQGTPAGVSAESAYTPDTGHWAEVNELNVMNGDSVSHTYSIYLDSAGSSYALNSALFMEINLPAKSADPHRNLQWFMRYGDNLGVQTNTASVLTFTVFGKEYP